MLGEQRLYPDGLIRVTRGAKSWTALVEVKTGPNQLAAEQLENYLDIAREQGFDAVITISNEIPAVAGQHPTKVDKRKLQEGRPAPLLLVSGARRGRHAEGVPRRRGPRPGLDTRRADPLPRAPQVRRAGVRRHGRAWVGVRDAVAAGTLAPPTRASPRSSRGSTRCCGSPASSSAGSSAPKSSPC